MVNIIRKKSINDSLFIVEKKDLVILFLTMIIGVLLYAFTSNIYVFAFSLIISIFYFSINKNNYVFISFLFLNQLISSSLLNVIYLSLVVLVMLISNNSHIPKKALIFSIFLTIYMSISYIIGVNAEINKLFLHILCIILYLCVCYKFDKKNYGLIIYGLFLMSIALILTILIKYLMGEDILKFGRLAFNDSIREVSNAVLIPLVFFTAAILYRKGLFNSFNKIETVILFLILCGTLLATISRGTIIAYLFGLFVLIVFNRNKVSKILNLFIVLGLICLIYLIVSNNKDFHFDRLFINDATLNGRSEIWMDYYKKVENNGIWHILFGMGPGDSKRFNVGTIYNNMYAHSTFFDIFLSYGMLGILLFFVILLNIFIIVIKSKNVIFLSAFCSIIINYLTHGVTYNCLFYVVLATIYGATKIYYKDRIV